MKRIAVLTVFFLSSFSGFSQNDKELRKFSETEKEIVRYRELSQQAWDKSDDKLALSYVDSVKASIVGSYVDDHVFKAVDDKVVSLKNLQKPVLLITSATWCAPCIAEIPALNKVAAEFSDRVTFVVLFDEVKKDKKLAKLVKKYSSQIAVVSSEEEDGEIHTLSISGFRHITGFPTNYSINTNGKIIGYSQGAFVATSNDEGREEKIAVTKEEADARNYAKLKDEVEFLLNESH